jgi:hypothetical protein
MGHKGPIQIGLMGCYNWPMGLTRWGPWVPWATALPPRPTQVLRLTSLAPRDPSQGTHAAHRKEPADTVATMDVI